MVGGTRRLPFGGAASSQVGIASARRRDPVFGQRIEAMAYAIGCVRNPFSKISKISDVLDEPLASLAAALGHAFLPSELERATVVEGLER